MRTEKTTTTQPSVRELIETFEIDRGPAELSFEKRLARENRWTISFAHRAIIEYRRFLILAVEAGHAVTPSDQVDQVWHLHLTYTRSYWDDLCGEILGRPLHHGPTRGGSAEKRRYHDQYEETRLSYRRLFGESPPEDIWPPSALRFGRDLHFRRVNLQEHWLLPRRLTVGVAGVLILIALVGAVGAMRMPSFAVTNPFLVWAPIAMVAAFLLTVYLQRRLTRCPRCLKRGKLKRTTRTRKRKNSWRQVPLYSCDSCNHLVTLPPSLGGGVAGGGGCGVDDDFLDGDSGCSGGGGGCGGDAGCGGGGCGGGCGGCG
jgi:hypothetical protein